MLPCRCSSCGRSGIPRSMFTVAVTMPVAHARDDHRDTIGIPCRGAFRLDFSCLSVDQATQFLEQQIRNLEEMDLDA